MSGDNLDPGTQSALIWSNALTLLRGNATLSARQKGWFEGVLPEAIYGTTIILAVENNETQRMLQTDLNSVLLQALKVANGGIELFPAFKILQSSTRATQPGAQVEAERAPSRATLPGSRQGQALLPHGPRTALLLL